MANERTGAVQTLRTDASGGILLTDLDKNTTYHIRQQQAPENYRADTADYALTVDANGLIDGQSSARLALTNRMLRVSVHAVDMVLRGDLDGEVLSLYNAQDQLVDSWTANGAGRMFTGLAEGGYYVVRGTGNDENAKRYSFTVQDTARQQDWNIPVFTLRSGIALAVGAALAAGVIWLLVFLFGLLARRRKAGKAAAQNTDEPENKQP